MVNPEPYGNLILKAILFLISALVGGLGGLFFGLIQWIGLRNKPLQISQWLVASVLGGALGMAVALPNLDGYITDTTLIIGVIMTIIGFAQWFVIKRQVEKNLWWLAAVVVSGLLTIATIWYAAPLIFAIFTGLTFPLMFKQPDEETQ